MGGVDVGEGGKGRRGVSAEVNLVPFIDLLFVTLAFLLITAVWSQSQQLATNAEVPGPPGPAPPFERRTLEVNVRAESFELAWREGTTVVSTRTVPRHAADRAGSVSYPELTKALAEEWDRFGQVPVGCMAPCQTIATLRTDDRLPFGDIAAVLDSLAAKKREAALPSGGAVVVPVFATTFSSR